MRIRSTGFLAIAALLLPMAQAQTLVFTPVGSAPPSAFAQTVFSGSLGLFFTTNQDVWVTSVGYWDIGLDGIQGANTVAVAIFQVTGTGTGSIVQGTEKTFNSVTGGPSTGTLTGGELTAPGSTAGEFRVYNLADPVELSAGTNFAVVAWYYGPLDADANGGGSALTSFNSLGGALTFTGSAYGNNNDGGTVPENGFSPNGLYLAGTFAASVIPEPSDCAAILGAVVLGMAAVRGMRRRQGPSVAAV